MKILILGLLLLGLSLTQSTTVTKKIEKSNTGNNPKLGITSKLEKPKDPSSKIDNIKIQAPTFIKSKEDQKYNLQLENTSDPKQVDRAKKSCRTINAQPTSPAKICMEISGPPSLMTICNEDNPIFPEIGFLPPKLLPQALHFPPGKPEPPASNLNNLPSNNNPQDISSPQSGLNWIYPASSYPLDFLIHPGLHDPILPSHIHIHSHPDHEYLPTVYQVSPQSPWFGLPQNHPNVALFHYYLHKLFPHISLPTGSGQGHGPNIYLRPGSQSGFPSDPGNLQFGNYPVGGYHCTCSQSPASLGNIIYRSSGSSPTLRAHTPLSHSSPRTFQFGPKLLQKDGESMKTLPLEPQRSTSGTYIYPTSTSQPNSVFPVFSNFPSFSDSINYPFFRASANVGGFEGLETPGGVKSSGISTVIKGPGIDSSTKIGLGLQTNSGNIPLQVSKGQTPQSVRYSQAITQPIQTLETWPSMSSLNQRFSRDESTQGDHSQQSQKQLQPQNVKLTSQMSPIQGQPSSSMLAVNTHQKRSQQNEAVPEKVNSDDEMVRNYQIQNAAMEQFIVDNTRQHENNPDINERYEEMERITN